MTLANRRRLSIKVPANTRHAFATVARSRRAVPRLWAVPEELEGRVLLSNFTVTNTLDDTHKGSLRWAINQVNSDKQPGTDAILFNIPGSGPFTISPLQPLPALTHPVVVNGYSQPGSQPNTLTQGDNAVILVRLDGINLQSQFSADGLAVSGGSSTVEGLDITGFNNGIHLQGSGLDAVTGNIIGLDLSGASAPNLNYGVLVDGVPSNSIGGAATSARNIVSGNDVGGINVNNSPNDVLQGNYIGTDTTGTQARGNGGSGGGGVSFTGSPFATVGGTTAGAGNLISANSFGGLGFTFGSNNVVIQGNLIGTDLTGSVALPNFDGGLSFTGSNITLGGTTAAARNVISGNDGIGVNLREGFPDAGTSNLIMGNNIGVDISGTKPLGNNGIGLNLDFMGNITIGGTTAGSANVISANNGDGIFTFSEEGGPELIAGNDIGTDATGTIALGNSSDGLAIEAAGVTVGGTSAAARNIISGNAGNGVNFFLVFSAPNPPNVVQGNSIGTDATGTIVLGNAKSGVSMGDFASGILIGGTDAGAGNIIADNGGAGVTVVGSDSQDDGILSNSIFANGALGIDLGGDGVTPNHSGGPVSGPNFLQNYPVLARAISTGGKTTIDGTLNSAANTSYLIQFFANATADPSGHGQGQRLIGSINVTTDSSGNASFTANLSMPVPAGQFVSATATDPSNNTSEFAQDVTVRGSNTGAIVQAVSTTSQVASSAAIALGTPRSATVGTAAPTRPDSIDEGLLEVLALERIQARNRGISRVNRSESSPING